MGRAPETNEAEWRQYRELLHTHPEQYLRIAEDTIRQYPDDPRGYRDCVTYWMEFEQYEYALSDIDTVLALGGSTMTRFQRGVVLRCLGRYREAIEEFNRCEAEEPRMFSSFLEIDRAACHASLGNLEAALADCARVPDDRCMPGFDGAPGGTKSQVIETIRRLAAEAQKS
jgi:tetratricopeptide (TPR) repeat protein